MASTYLSLVRIPKYNVFLNRIKHKIYRPVLRLTATYAPSREPVEYAERETLAYKSARRGKKWGDMFDCAWYHFTGKLPDDCDKSKLIGLLELGGEGCVWQKGVPVQGITNVLSVADFFQTLRGKKLVTLDKLDVDENGAFDFWVECGYNGIINNDIGSGRFKRAIIAEQRSDLLEFYYDFYAAYSAYVAMKDDAKHREYGDNAARYKSTLNQAMRVGRSLSKEAVAAAREVLARLNGDKAEESFTVYAVGHAHLDLSWLWPERETKRKAERTYTNALSNIEQYPWYVFGSSQPQQFEWIKERRPELYERIKQAVASGGIEPQGGMWCEPDTNLPSGESLIRQCYYGKKFFRDEFDKDVRFLWVPDVFGYSGALPQIIKKSGMDYFMTIKLSWNTINKFPYHSFNWEGIDNSIVTVHMPPLGNYNCDGTPYEVMKSMAELSERRHSKIALLPFGAGDGGGGPGEFSIKMLERASKHDNPLPKVVFSGAQAFFDKLEEDREKLPYHKGELYLEKHQGTYTTQGRNKLYNRLNERLLHNAEWLSTVAPVQYPNSQLDEIWKRTLLYQFHDIIPGSSIHRVYEECKVGYEDMQSRLKSLSKQAINALPKDSSFSVLNGIGLARKGYVKVDKQWYFYQAEAYSSAVPEPIGECELHFSDNSMENSRIKAVFNEYGEITLLIDKETGENAVGTVFNRMSLYRDKKMVPYDAWDIDINYTKHKPKRLKVKKVKTYIDGARIVRKCEYEFGKSEIEQKIILYNDSPMLIFETEVEWEEKHKMLRADFYPSHFGDLVKCDIQFGSIDRSTREDNQQEYAQFEIAAHKWVDVYDNGFGTAILNDCKYGHRAKNGLVSLNLLRATTYPDKTADRHEHEFTYAVYPHALPAVDSELIRLGYELNNPVIVTEGTTLAAPAELVGDGVMIESILSTPDGLLALRLYEYKGRDSDAELRILSEYKTVYESNLIFDDRVALNDMNLHFTPFEIKTILIEK